MTVKQVSDFTDKFLVEWCLRYASSMREITVTRILGHQASLAQIFEMGQRFHGLAEQVRHTPDDPIPDWSIEDILGSAHGLGYEPSEDEAKAILAQIGRGFDATIGISWDVVENNIEDYAREHGLAERQVHEWHVSMQSIEFGLEEVGPYDSMQECVEVIEQLQAKAAELDDGIRRWYRIVPPGGEEEEYGT